MNYLNSATSRRKPATEDLYRWTECQTPATKPNGFGGGLGDVNKSV